MHVHSPPLLLLLVIAGACRVGPDYTPPTIEVAERFGPGPAGEEAPVVDAWWETFADPALRSCVEAAFAANLDLRSSLERLRAARALRRVESSGYWPRVGAGAGYTSDRISENSPRFAPAVEQGLFDREVEYWDVGFDVAWELDLFGGLRRRVEGATAELQRQEAERGALMLSIAAEVARSYFELRGNQERLRLLEERIANEGARGEILLRKQQGGLLALDRVLQSRSRQEALRSSGPRIEAAIRSGEYRLAVLMGRQPQAGVPELAPPRALPTPQGQVPTGLPSELLRRRPDVLAAERRIAAASADIGVATAEFFPAFYLTGSPFLQAADFGELFRSSSSGWLFGPSVSWNVFSAGRNEAQLAAAQAYHREALLGYEATVQRVLEEVESSLVRYGKGVESLALLTQAADLEHRRAALEALRGESGIADRIDELEARGLALAADELRLEQQVDVLVDLVGLHKALGGGWPQAETIARAAAGMGEGS